MKWPAERWMGFLIVATAVTMLSIIGLTVYQRFGGTL